jgi:hypothetical protein
MEFEQRDYATLISSSGKIPHLMAKDTFGPSDLFMAGIGG